MARPRLVRAKFPGVIVIRSDVSHGLVVQRNRGARLAPTPFIFSIDDDAVYSTPHVVEQTLAEFDAPRIGAVAIPFIDPLKSDRLMQQAPSRERIWITDSFIGTAHALRRDLFLQLDGYRETLVHQGEEKIIAFACLIAAGQLGPHLPLRVAAQGFGAHGLFWTAQRHSFRLALCAFSVVSRVFGGDVCQWRAYGHQDAPILSHGGGNLRGLLPMLPALVGAVASFETRLFAKSSAEKERRPTAR